MESVLDLAPDGDLVIALGKDENRKLVRVESTILRLVSPPFKIMLSPAFREGQTPHDTLNPLELPEDEPDAMLNFLRVIHLRSDEVQMTGPYLPKLAVVCDKYLCASRFREFFHIRCETAFTDKLLFLVDSISSCDKFVISALTEDKDKFREYSEEVVRMDRDTFDCELNPCLRGLISVSILDGIEAFQRNVREAYIVAAQIPINALYKAHSGRSLCPGSRRRLEAYTKHLYWRNVFLGSDVTCKEKLSSLEETVRTTDPDSWGSYTEFNKYTCDLGNRRCICDHDFDASIKEAVDGCDMGRDGECEMCLQCIAGGEFALEKTCDLHSTVDKGVATPSDVTSKTDAP